MTETKIKELTNKYVKIAIITIFDYLKRNINTSREIKDIKKEKTNGTISSVLPQVVIKS